MNLKQIIEDIILYKNYTPEEYPNYDNYDAINVDKTKEIPMDYKGLFRINTNYNNISRFHRNYAE